MEKDNKHFAHKLVQDFFSKVWHPPHNLEAIDQLMTEDYLITTAGKTIRGRQAFKSWVGEFQKQLVDAKTESLDLFYAPESSKVVSRWICSGKNNGLFGSDPDNRFVSFSGIAIWTIRDKKLAQCWVERSAHELYQKIKKGDNRNDFV